MLFCDLMRTREHYIYFIMARCAFKLIVSMQKQHMCTQLIMQDVSNFLNYLHYSIYISCIIEECYQTLLSTDKDIKWHIKVEHIESRQFGHFKAHGPFAKIHMLNIQKFHLAILKQQHYKEQ